MSKDTMFASDRHGPNEGSTTLDRWTIDRHKSAVSEQRLDDNGLEFPRINERLMGKPYRYGYATEFGTGFKLGCLKKHDLKSQTCEIHSEGAQRIFLEPVFIPKHPDADEDEGWVMAYVYDQSTDKSDVVILEAQNFAGEPVATIHLPRRVPYGFHGNWIADE